MKNLKIDILEYQVGDKVAKAKLQTKCNQWLTADVVKKIDITSAGDYIVYTVCRKKSS